MDKPPQRAVIITVKNEAEALRPVLDGLAAQRVAPDEVVIVDGGSTDGTWEQLTDFAASTSLPFRLVPIRAEGANISAGRNLAVRKASAEIIAATDAGVVLPADWLAEIGQPILSGAADWVAGFFVADPRTPFELALGVTTLPALEDIDPDTFLPSSRSVAFRRSVFDGAGGYPEWLDYGEDLVFDIRAEHAAGRPAFAPGAAVLFRPRRSLAGFFKQYYLYARGDGKADLWPQRHAVRYGTYLLAVPVIVALAVAQHPLWLLVGLGGLAMMLRRAYRRLWRWGSGAGQSAVTMSDRVVAALWIPVIQIAGDLAKMIGYPVGVWWRWRNGRHAWRPVPGVGIR